MHLSGAVAHLNVCVNVCISSEKRNKERGKQNQQQQLMDGWIAEAACFDHQHVRLLAAFHPSDPSRCTPHSFVVKALKSNPRKYEPRTSWDLSGDGSVSYP